METSEHRTPNRVRHVAAAIACALALQLGWPAVAGAKPCKGEGSTTKCTLDSECCGGLVCNRRCQRGCKIGGVFYENGARNPLNDCQSCQSLVSRFAWASLASGVTCGGAPSGQCDAQNRCNGAGACIDNVLPATTACAGASQGGACDDDAADRCSGTSKACVDAFDGASVVCRSSAGQCDVAETCTGTSGTCPGDGFAAATASCTGASQAGACDDDASDHCSGGANTCVDAYESSTTVCRSSTGQCDVLETCPGTSGACPADAFAPSTEPCMGPGGGRPCDDDAADHCSGTADVCIDAFEALSTVCRSAAGDCDVAETCTGGGACPAEQLAPATQVCRLSAGECDLPDRCTGITPVCPADARNLPGVECRAAAGACDVAEVCNGDAACPADGGAEPSGTVCRVQAGFCDVAETCNGTSSACPADAFVPMFTLCRRPGAIVEGGESVGGFGECDLSESCTGSDAQCPADVLRAPEFVCGPSLGPCDFEETCLAGGKNCPSDAKAGPGTQCRAPDSSKPCDAGGVCAGGGDVNCPANSPKAASTVCRESGGLLCDPTDVCNGTSLDCPADDPAPAGTMCAEAAQCRDASLCSGFTGNSPGDYFCPPQQFSMQGTPCGAAETGCRAAGFCTIAGRCATPPKANGTPCDLSATEPGECSAGTCFAITCQYNIECPDGNVCQGGQCVRAQAGNAGAACNPGACGTGLECCAGMEGTGRGGLAEAGESGRCAACCGPFPSDGGCPIFENFLECCDGECRLTEMDLEHCGGCAYAGGGGNACVNGLSACTPQMRCLEGVCDYTSGCPRVGEQAFECRLPSTGELSPACLEGCQADLQTCVAACGSGPACADNCSLFNYGCVDQCPDLVTPECLDWASDYAGCDKTCSAVSTCASAGAVCSTNGECCSESCKSTCRNDPRVGGGVLDDCNEPSFCE